MMRGLKATMVAAAVVTAIAGSAWAEEAIVLPKYQWQHDGMFGTIDKAAARRGVQVFKQICSSCHGLKLASFRNLEGLGYTPDQVKAFAADFTVIDGLTEDGELARRPGLPPDRIPSPFVNEKAAAAANGGVAPPDLSVMAKARKGGENYIVSVLTGYEDPPADWPVVEGKYYNRYFPGHNINMPQMLMDGGIEYEDGTTDNSALHQAKDVATFLVYMSEPHMDQRKELGWRVMLFLLVFTALMYATKRELWSKIKH